MSTLSDASSPLTRLEPSMPTRRSSRRTLLFLVLAILPVVATQPGCVTRGRWNTLQAEHEEVVAERDRLIGENERLIIERDAYETQFVETQETLEDERIVREGIASELQAVSAEAVLLDESLVAERRAHLAAAAALVARETELVAMQSTYDQLVGDLESEVSAGQIEIERLREGLRLNVSDEVLFASGSATLDEAGRRVLTKVAGQLQSLKDFVEVRGHTDNIRIRSTLAKRYPTNWELAAARAARVVRLLEEEGVAGERLAVVSLGPNDPVAPNDTPAGRARNRRIEIRLIPSRRSSGEHQASAEPSRPAPKPAGQSTPGSAPTEPAAPSEAAGKAPAAPPPPAPSKARPAPSPAASAKPPAAPSPPAPSKAGPVPSPAESAKPPAAPSLPASQRPDDSGASADS